MHAAWPHILCVLLAFSSADAMADVPASLRLGTLTVTLADTRLSQVREEIGSGHIDRHGAAAWLCYTVNAKTGLQRFWISAGDGGLEATGFTAEVVTNGEGPSPACPALPAKFTPPAIGNGLWLGLTRTELEQRTGVTAKPSGARFTFEFAQAATAANKLTVEITDGRAARLWLTTP